MGRSVGRGEGAGCFVANLSIRTRVSIFYFPLGYGESCNWIMGCMMGANWPAGPIRFEPKPAFADLDGGAYQISFGPRQLRRSDVH